MVQTDLLEAKCRKQRLTSGFFGAQPVIWRNVSSFVTMCSDVAFVWFVIAKLFMNTANGMPTAKEQEINLKLHLSVPDKSSMVSYPSIINTQASTSLLSAYQSIQPPQPPVPPMRPLNIRFPSVFSQQPVNRWGSIMRSRKKPSLVIHQPVVNYHYTPSAYVPPTRFVHKPLTSTTTMRPIIIVSGFKDRYNSRRSTSTTTTSTTSHPPVDLEELLKEFKESVQAKPVTIVVPSKAEDCQCDDSKDTELQKNPVSKGGGNSYDTGKPNEEDFEVNFSKDEDFDVDNSEDYFDSDEDDSSPEKVTPVRTMWGGYVPKKVLRDALKQSMHSPKRKIVQSRMPKRHKKKMYLDVRGALSNNYNHYHKRKGNNNKRKGNNRKRKGVHNRKKTKRKYRPKRKKGVSKAALNQFKTGLSALAETIKSQDKEADNTLEELEDDDDDDDSEDNEVDGSRLNHVRVPRYHSDVKHIKTVKGGAVDFNEDPYGWNPKYTKGLWSEDDSHLQVISKYNHTPRDEEHDEEEMGEFGEEYNKYKRSPAVEDTSRVFNESVEKDHAENGSRKKVTPKKDGEQGAKSEDNASAESGVNKMIKIKNRPAVRGRKRRRRKEDSKEEDESSLGSEEAKSEYVESDDADYPKDLVAHVERPPKGSRCRSVGDVSNDGKQTSHVRGFSCHTDYDDDNGEDDATNEDIVNSIDRSNEDTS